MSQAGTRGIDLPIIIGIAIGVLCFLPPIIRPSAFILDDSYFYLQVAYRIVTTGQSTFNGITATNGYHPLWMIFMILVMLVSGANKMIALHAVIVMQCMILIGIIYVWRKLAELINLRMWEIGLGLLGIYFVSFGLFASEAFVNGFMILATVLVAVMAINRRAERYIWYSSLLGGISVLARLDNIFMVAVILAIVFVSCSDRPLIARQNGLKLVAVALPFACILGPYLCWNWINYGHVVPISGVIKSTFPFPDWGLRKLGRLGYVVFAVAIISISISSSRAMPQEMRAALGSLGIGTILHSLYVVVFTNECTTWNWYYVGGVINLSVCGCVIAGKGADWLRRIYRTGVSEERVGSILAIILGLVGACSAWATFYDPEIMVHPFYQHNRPWAISFAKRMEHTVSPETRMLVWDMPGTFAYWSNLSIFPEDGLMSDFRANYEMLEYGAQKYFSANNITMYVGPWDKQCGIMDKCVQSPLYRKRKIGCFELRARDIVMAEKVSGLSLIGFWRRVLQTHWVAVWKIE